MKEEMSITVLACDFAEQDSEVLFQEVESLTFTRSGE